VDLGATSLVVDFGDAYKKSSNAVLTFIRAMSNAMMKLTRID
jgi:hypothetical protein